MLKALRSASHERLATSSTRIKKKYEKRWWNKLLDWMKRPPAPVACAPSPNREITLSGNGNRFLSKASYIPPTRRPSLDVENPSGHWQKIEMEVTVPSGWTLFPLRSRSLLLLSCLDRERGRTLDEEKTLPVQTGGALFIQLLSERTSSQASSVRLEWRRKMWLVRPRFFYFLLQSTFISSWSVTFQSLYIFFSALWLVSFNRFLNGFTWPSKKELNSLFIIIWCSTKSTDFQMCSTRLE